MKISKLVLLGVLLMLQFSAFAQDKITLTLDNVSPNIICDEAWVEEDLDLHFTTTTNNDCAAGSCFFGIEPDFVWLFPSRLSVDVSSLPNIKQVEVDIVDFCGANCTKAFLIDNADAITDMSGNTIIGSAETLTITASVGTLKELVISSCEAQIHEIRICYDKITAVQQIADSPFSIYPNPSAAKDDLHIEFPVFANDFLLSGIQLFTLDGKMIYQKDLKGVTNTLTIPATDLPVGVFLVQFVSEGQLFTEKIVRL